MTSSGIHRVARLKRFKVVLWVHLAILVAFQSNRVAADEGKRPAEPSSSAKPMSFSADILENQQTITVDVGTQLVGTSVKVEVSLKNTLDTDLNLDLKPSCNCTALSTLKMRAAKSEAIVIRTEVKIPASAKKFQSSIMFVDQQRTIAFALVVEANVIDSISIEPSPLVIDRSDIPFSTTISVRPSGSNIKIIKAVSESERLRFLEAQNPEATKYAIVIQPSERKDELEESLSIRVVYEHTTPPGESAVPDSKTDLKTEPITRDFFLAVRYTDRVSIGPSLSTWRLVDGRYRAKLYLLGISPESNLDQGKLLITNGKVNIPVQTEKLTKRADKAVIFEGSFDEMDLPTFGENETWKIEFESLKCRASSQVVFEASK
jgi:hypothetical protein